MHTAAHTLSPKQQRASLLQAYLGCRNPDVVRTSVPTGTKAEQLCDVSTGVEHCNRIDGTGTTLVSPVNGQQWADDKPVVRHLGRRRGKLGQLAAQCTQGKCKQRCSDLTSATQRPPTSITRGFVRPSIGAWDDAAPLASVRWALVRCGSWRASTNSTRNFLLVAAEPSAGCTLARTSTVALPPISSIACMAVHLAPGVAGGGRVA